MPWTVDDVDKHKKGLSESGKKRWVRIANGILDQCKDAGQDNCDQKAIRVANSKVGDDSGRNK